MYVESFSNLKSKQTQPVISETLIVLIPLWKISRGEIAETGAAKAKRQRSYPRFNQLKIIFQYLALGLSSQSQCEILALAFYHYLYLLENCKVWFLFDRNAIVRSWNSNMFGRILQEYQPQFKPIIEPTVGQAYSSRDYCHELYNIFKRQA